MQEDSISCAEVYTTVLVLAKKTGTYSPPPPSLPVISVRDAVYEYETVGTLHSQTHADTQDTVEHQTRQRDRRERRETIIQDKRLLTKSASKQLYLPLLNLTHVQLNMEAYQMKAVLV